MAEWLRRWAYLSKVEATRYNPPDAECWVDGDGTVYIDQQADEDRWLYVGFVPKPRTRWGWFLYHLIHGLAMRYPWHKVILFALLNTKPGEDGQQAASQAAALWQED